VAEAIEAAWLWSHSARHNSRRRCCPSNADESFLAIAAVAASHREDCQLMVCIAKSLFFTHFLKGYLMKSTKMLIAAAAMGGLIAGAAMNVSASTTGAQSVKKSMVQSQVGAKASSIALDKHDCKGMNSCKGQGGCSAGDNGCKGKNSCKGKGGCKTGSVL
jgi:hypothetical protein